MKTIVAAILILLSQVGLCDETDKIAISYFNFLLEEDGERFNRADELVSQPIVGRFSSQDGHRMIIVSAQISDNESYYALMGENELNMGYLAWKARGYGQDAQQDQAYYLRYDGTEFGYDGW
ncbi:hypothetical protein [Microbulbifer sp. YPW16]|uniref:hypothetical protein n=1 Tax=Microbulbifer sp. YPW16 TaxID=2904242 RepID=UPI001E41FBEE|nr:hypothetical protein [Microbulbifer sp. YPW16]UHQ56497.1 hypothetical protein LVE68_05850 [Microbulbifer sp. YPW16]